MKRVLFLSWLTAIALTIISVPSIPIATNAWQTEYPQTEERHSMQLHPMPPHPALAEKLKANAPLRELLAARFQRGIDAPNLFPAPPSGPFNLLVVAVDFPDVAGGTPPSFFDTLFFQSGGVLTGPGSVADYFTQVSYGNFNLTMVSADLPGTLGWQRASNNQIGYYVDADGIPLTSDDYGWGSYPQNLQGIVTNILPKLDMAGVDFSRYDNDGDGFVESIIFVHAGTGAEISGSPSDIWSSAWNLSSNQGPGPQLVDGVYVDNFLFGPEFWLTPLDLTIGVYCHEMGHSIFGLPDLYDADWSSNGVGNWSLMGSGSWNGPAGWGNVPAWPDAWSRLIMGFDTPTAVSGSMLNYAFNPIEGNPGQAVVLKSNQLNAQEYFLVEFRDQAAALSPVNFDQYLPGSGLLIWHIDETKWNTWEHNTQECTNSIDCNCPTAHYLVTLEQADGLLDLENAVNWGDPGDPFMGSSGNANFTSGTSPESVSYYAATCSPTPSDSCISIQNIHIISPYPVPIFGDINTVCRNPFPPACLEIIPSHPVGWGQPGTEAAYQATIQNCSNAYEFAVTVQSQSNWPVTFFNPGTGLPYPGDPQNTIFPGATWSVGISVTVPAEAGRGAADMLNLRALSGIDPTYSQQEWITTQVPNCILVVDDDLSAPNVESSYLNALTFGTFGFDYWDTNLRGMPDLATLEAHPGVVWFTGMPWVYTLHPREEIALARYLDGGGQLFLSSQDYLSDADRTDFNRAYLGVATFSTDTGTNLVSGVPGNPVGSGLGPFLLNTYAPMSDRITALPPSQSAFVDSLSFTNALTYDSGTWKTLFLAWPFENLSQPNADQLMAAVMGWFGVPPRPIAGFTASHSIATVGETISLTNASLNATAYFWQFGDGITSTLTNPTHTYTTAMTTTLSLTSSNCCGADETSQIISIYNPPIAGFAPSPNPASPGQAVTFTNSSLFASNYQWDFGDGSGTSHDPCPSYIYSQAGTYTVTLTASNPAAADTLKQPIQVAYHIFLPLTARETGNAARPTATDAWRNNVMALIAPLASPEINH